MLRRFVLSARWVSLALLSLVLYALYLVGSDSQFYLTLIPVEGASSIPPSEIVAASQIAGSHIFAVDPQRAAGRIAEMPGVISATVTLNWPNEVQISLREDTPIAVWTEGEERRWVTEDGRFIPARADVPNLLRIEAEVAALLGATSAEAVAETGEVETAVAIDEPLTVTSLPTEILEGARQLKALRPDIGQLYYRPSDGLSFEDPRGWRVYMGIGTDMHQKLVVYDALVAELLARDLTPEYVSVSNQETPYYLAR